jgi:hypothetical protein
MEIFAFISLALSIFGSALAAFAGLRSHYEREILTAIAEVGAKVTTVAARGDKSKKEAQGKEKKLRRWVRTWTICQWLPIAFFSVLTSLIAFYVCFVANCDNNGIFISSKIPVLWIRWSVGIFFLMNIGCFYTALRARVMVRTMDSDLDGLASVAKDSDTPDVISL